MATITTLNAGDEVDASVLNTNFSNLNTDISNHSTSITSLGTTVTSLQTTVSTISGQISGGNLVPVGTVIWFTKNTAPTGYLICNGSAVSRTDYADLFAKIGTTFGAGDESTTFNLPDLINKTVYGSTTLNDNSLNTGNQSADHRHQMRGIMGGGSSWNTELQNADHSHAIPVISLLPCIKY